MKQQKEKEIVTVQNNSKIRQNPSQKIEINPQFSMTDIKDNLAQSSFNGKGKNIPEFFNVYGQKSFAETQSYNSHPKESIGFTPEVEKY